jgi:hydrogenase expression/formation protein HypD
MVKPHDDEGPMAAKRPNPYRDSMMSQILVDLIKKVSKKDIRLMEVCGTHTMAIFRNGIETVLPENISLLSGPGCPVCVTSRSEIDAFIALSRKESIIVATFGDLMRVPGTASSLQRERARGRDIRVVYSTFDALEIARKNPRKKIVFPGVGFETTSPTVAAAVISAKETGIENFSVYSAHKLIPPALNALMEGFSVRVNGFMLPGHVSVIIGVEAYLPFFMTHHIPAAIAGFEPVDILKAIYMLVRQIESDEPNLENGYLRAVTYEGNKKAQEIMKAVFEPVDVVWRGLGTIPGSGLKIREEFGSFDAGRLFDISIPHSEEHAGCACGEILTGLKIPPDCPLYKQRCTPLDPIGPCMVSGEGTCAAYYRYHKG